MPKTRMEKDEKESLMNRPWRGVSAVSFEARLGICSHVIEVGYIQTYAHTWTKSQVKSTTPTYQHSITLQSRRGIKNIHQIYTQQKHQAQQSHPQASKQKCTLQKSSFKIAQADERFVPVTPPNAMSSSSALSSNRRHPSPLRKHTYIHIYSIQLHVS